MAEELGVDFLLFRKSMLGDLFGGEGLTSSCFRPSELLERGGVAMPEGVWREASGEMVGVM